MFVMVGVPSLRSAGELESRECCKRRRSGYANVTLLAVNSPLCDVLTEYPVLTELFGFTGRDFQTPHGPVPRRTATVANQRDGDVLTSFACCLDGAMSHRLAGLRAESSER